jgi:recombination protein RecA
VKRARLKGKRDKGAATAAPKFAKPRLEPGGNYFASPKRDLKFIPSGSKTLDLALGGGWAENRIFNIVGDKSTGKTLLCIEAAANFAARYPKGRIRYAECESAFDPKYAEALGMPLDRVDFGEPLETVEDLFEELDHLVKTAKHPTLYFLDSLDALSDRAEMGRDFDEGSYGMGKAKQMSQLFRRLVTKLSASNVTLGVVSQIRDNVGAMMFQKKTRRSGGHALDFYASQVVYLAQLGTEKKTISGIERPIGLKIKAKVEKNKVGLPYREAEFEIGFGYGIDDYKSCLEWLSECGSIAEVGIAKTEIKKEARAAMKWDREKFAATISKVHEVVERRWYEIEQSFMPARRKY